MPNTLAVGFLSHFRFRDAHAPDGFCVFPPQASGYSPRPASPQQTANRVAQTQRRLTLSGRRLCRKFCVRPFAFRYMRSSARKLKRPQALVIGSFESYERQALTFAAARAQTALLFHQTLSSSLEELESPDAQLSCVLVTSEHCSSVATWIRGRADYFNVPIVALVAHASDATYRFAYADGADDAMLRVDLGGITRRLANLSERPTDIRPPANQGLGIIAFPDIPRRRILGRTLRTAGFDVAYAASQDELLQLVKGENRPTLIVTHPNFPELGGRSAIQRVRQMISEPNLPALLLPADEREERFHTASSDSEQSGKLLFFAEEALRGTAKNLRAFPRLLHNGLCAFREAGSLEPIYGLTHNVSRQGLYVRTLDPPRPGSMLWFEMRAPGHAGELVHLRGRVMWRREPGQMGGTAPAGFGLRIEEHACPVYDLALYQQAYDRLRNDTSRNSISPAVATAQGGE